MDQKTHHPVLTGKTRHDVVLDWRNHGTITVPRGTRVSTRTARESTDGSWFFVDEFAFLQSGLKHDAEHYGIIIQAGDVELDSVQRQY